MERDGVGGVESKGSRVGRGGLLLVAEGFLDLLMELVSCPGAPSVSIAVTMERIKADLQVYLVWVTTSPRSSVK